MNEKRIENNEKLDSRDKKKHANKIYPDNFQI